MTTEEITPTLIEEFLVVRASGATNMFDRRGVQHVAAQMELPHLVMYAEDGDWVGLLDAVTEHLKGGE